MAAENYKACLAFTLKWEGGWSNHPRDPGGATMKGVIQRTYDKYRDRIGQPRRSVRHIADNELQSIYRSGYWNAVNGDSLAAGVDLAVWDYGVNSGPSRARRALLAVINGKSLSPVETAKAVCRQRLSFVRGLRTFSTFGKGWSRRIAQCEALGVQMALAATGATQRSMTKELHRDAEAAEAQAKSSGTAGTAAGGAGVATGFLGGLNWQVVTIAGLVMILLGLLAFFCWRNRQHKQELAKAYRQAAEAAAQGVLPDFETGATK